MQYADCATYSRVEDSIESHVVPCPGHLNGYGGATRGDSSNCGRQSWPPNDCPNQRAGYARARHYRGSGRGTNRSLGRARHLSVIVGRVRSKQYSVVGIKCDLNMVRTDLELKYLTGTPGKISDNAKALMCHEGAHPKCGHHYPNHFRCKAGSAGEVAQC
jgi:hypothetical protein